MSLRNLLKAKHAVSKPSYDDLINAESKLGRMVFGPIPDGHRREFFESKPNVWIWYESFINHAGVYNEMTVRYEVRPTGVYKKPAGGAYEKINGQELDNFRRAAASYLKLIKTKLY